MTVLEKYGRYSCVIRPELRTALQNAPNKNKLVNDLLSKHFKIKPSTKVKK